MAARPPTDPPAPVRGECSAVLGLFPPGSQPPAILAWVQAARVALERVEVLSALPLPEVPRRPRRPSLYTITILAGLAGIVIGVFFAAGTAWLYPIRTGGKMIAPPPIVGIISYETMMLTAIVVTFVTMAWWIARRQPAHQVHDPRINDGYLGVLVQLERSEEQDTVERLLREAGAVDIRLLPGEPAARRWTAAVVLAASLTAAGCSRDMEQQAAYQPQEGPRLHSPERSIPRESRAAVVARTDSPDDRVAHGRRLFAINCAHCHGRDGEGDGPVAGYLISQPANLEAHAAHHPLEKLYETVTHGRDGVMPPFKGLLSEEDRWAVAAFVRTIGPRRAPGEPGR